MKVDFFCIGAARCGTTTFHNTMKQHDDVFLPNVKELNFFSDVESLNQEDYILPSQGKTYHSKIIKSKFVYSKQYEGSKSNQLKGDISPSYLWEPGAAKRIYDYNQDAKLVVILREPVDRAVSHYKMNFYTGYESSKKFKEALLKPEINIWGGGNQYLNMGLYYNQLKPYLKLFKRSQILIIFFEDYIKNELSTINLVCDFLGISNFKKLPLNENKNSIQGFYFLPFINTIRKSRMKPYFKKVIGEKNISDIKLILGKNRNLKADVENYSTYKYYFKNDIINLSNELSLDLLSKWNYDK